MTSPSSRRRPAAFRLNDPSVAIATSVPDAPRTAEVVLTPEAKQEIPALPAAPPRCRRWLTWGKLFWIGLGGLVLMGFGLAVVQLLEELFARADALGYLGACPCNGCDRDWGDG